MVIGDLEKRFVWDSCFRPRNISTTFGVNNLTSFQMQFDIFLSKFWSSKICYKIYWFNILGRIKYTKTIYSINFVISIVYHDKNCYITQGTHYVYFCVFQMRFRLHRDKTWYLFILPKYVRIYPSLLSPYILFSFLPCTSIFAWLYWTMEAINNNLRKSHVDDKCILVRLYHWIDPSGS